MVQFFRVVATLFVASVMGCGGGGGDGGASTPPTPPAPSPPVAPIAVAEPVTTPAASTLIGQNGSLVLTEVGSVVYADDIAWVEVYNPNAFPVDLSLYTFKSPSINRTGGAFDASQMASFALPAVAVPSRSFFVIAGKVSDALVNGPQIRYVNAGAMVPHWADSGAIELVKQGVTVDFVRFGSVTTAPITAAHWSGSNVSGIPAQVNDGGKSIVRPASAGMMDTNTAADWTQVNFATPGGVNDIAAGVADSDGDGVPDSAKLAGNTYAGMDLYAMGARPGQRDLFLQVDHMSSTDPAIKPRREALQKLASVFAAKNLAPQKNIVIHVDAGATYAASFDPASFNLGGGQTVAYAACIGLATVTPTGCTSVAGYKAANFDLRRTYVFHYALFGNSQNANGSCGSAGIAWLPGADFMVTVGGCQLSTDTAASTNVLINTQAAVLMHELGHNLGLAHGGFENNNYKPNYHSIMNYMYSLAGLSANPSGPNAAQRYYYANQMKGVTLCTLENSPCGTSFLMTYSDGVGQDLNEASLHELDNIGYGSIGPVAYADWNNNNLSDSARYSRNLHVQDSSYGLATLKDYNDWANLKLAFSRNYTGATLFGNLSVGRPVAHNGTGLRATHNAMNPLSNDNAIHEDSMPAHHRRAIREKAR